MIIRASRRSFGGMRRGSGRPSFSLVELLVAMALIVFIMSVLSAAFGAASKAVRDLKSAGDNAERLRGALTLLRHDLGAPHFDGQRKLSSANFWQYGQSPNELGPPPEGFFRLWQEKDTAVDKDWPPGQLPPYPLKATPPANELQHHTRTRSMLHFTSRLGGESPGDMFSTILANPINNPTPPPATIPNPLVTLGGAPSYEQRFMDGSTTFRSQWAELVWWLTPSLDSRGNQELTSADPEEPGFTPQPLWTLRRRARLLWHGTHYVGNVDVENTAINEEISFRNTAGANKVRVNRPADLAPPFRLGMMPPVTTPAPGSAYNADQERAYAGWPNAAPAYPTSGVKPLAPFPTARADFYPTNRPEDIVLNHVLSMDVRLLTVRGGTFVDLFDPSLVRFAQGYPSPVNNPLALVNRNPNYRFTTSQGPLVFDTWSRSSFDGFDYAFNDLNQLEPTTGNPPGTLAGTSAGAVPTLERWTLADQHSSIPLFRDLSTGQTIRIYAIQIVLRIWDAKSGQSRQATLVVDL